MKVTLKDAKSNSKQIEVEPSSLVSQLKEKAVKEYTLPDVASVKLIFRGKLLVDDKTLESYDIKEASLINLMVVKMTPAQIANEKDYQEHKAVALSHPGRRST